MLGAKDVAFPRLNLASFYIYVIGALFAAGRHRHAAASTPAGRSTRRTARRPSGSVIPVTLGVFILGFSSIFTGLNFIVTIHKLRPPGMGWFNMPLFVWGLYATAIIQVLATPVLGITLLLLMVETGVPGSAFSIPLWAATRCCTSTSSGSTRTRRSTS